MPFFPHGHTAIHTDFLPNTGVPSLLLGSPCGVGLNEKLGNMTFFLANPSKQEQ